VRDSAYTEYARRVTLSILEVLRSCSGICAQVQEHATKIALISLNFRKSGMKHVEFLDNLSESEYVAREY
jgi:hypothetical protein